MRRRTVKSASRAFEVLELFADLRRPLRLNEIHTALGYPQSSTTTLLKSMVMSGYLNYSRHSRTYLPTTQVSALGNWLTGHIVADPAYRDLVEGLQRITDETVGLATENDLYIQYVLFREPSHDFKSVPREGVMRPMIDSAAGLALLSQMKDRQIEKIFRYSHYYRMGEGEAHSLDHLMQDIRWIRQIGYAHHENRPDPGLSAIAMPLGQTMYGVRLAIGVGGLVDRIAKAKSDIVRAMREQVSAFHLANRDAFQKPSDPAEIDDEDGDQSDQPD